MEHKQIPIEEDSLKDPSFLEPYYAPKRFSAKFWRNLMMVVATIAAVIYYKSFVINNSMSRDELKVALELSEVSSQWIVKEKINRKEKQGILLTPEFSFRLRNSSRKKLSYIYFLGVFRFEDTGKSLGEGFRMTIKSGLVAGEKSTPIRLVSMGGYTASSVDAFMKNKKEWRRVYVDLFAQTKNSGMVLLGRYNIARRIEGREIEVRI